MSTLHFLLLDHDPNPGIAARLSQDYNMLFCQAHLLLKDRYVYTHTQSSSHKMCVLQCTVCNLFWKNISDDIIKGSDVILYFHFKTSQTKSQMYTKTLWLLHEKCSFYWAWNITTQVQRWFIWEWCQNLLQREERKTMNKNKTFSAYTVQKCGTSLSVTTIRTVSMWLTGGERAVFFFYLQTVVCRCVPAPLWPSSLHPQPSSPLQQWALGTLNKNIPTIISKQITFLF